MNIYHMQLTLGQHKLLYIWHKKKQQYAHSSWGLVAPISLDTQSRAQRAHASETIHAYCANHSLHLVAVIVLPQPSPARGNSSNRRHTINSPSNGSLEQDMWEHSVGHLGHLMMEPILMVEDYIDMLKKTSGRVIMLSICLYNQCPCEYVPSRFLGVSPIFSGIFTAFLVGWKMAARSAEPQLHLGSNGY